MSLRTRLEALVSAIGADIKALQLAVVTQRWVRVESSFGLNVNLNSPSLGMFAPNIDERILLYAQDQPYQNGIYIYKGFGVPMVRADDADNEWDFVKGKLVYDPRSFGYMQYTGPSNPAVGATPLTFVSAPSTGLAAELDDHSLRLTSVETDVSRAVAEPCHAVYTSNVVLSNEFFSAAIFPGDRVLLVGQTTKTDNGVYTPSPDTGSGSFLTRVADEVYWAGKLFPVVTKTQLSTDDDYSAPVIYACTDYKGADRYVFTQLTTGASVVPVVSTLPAVTAADHGKEVYLRVDEAGTYGGPFLWNVKYMHYKADGVTVNPETYKWDVISAAELYNITPIVLVALSDSTAYHDGADIGPRITLPFGGVYAARIGATADAALPEGSGQVAMSLVNFTDAPTPASGLIADVKWRSNNFGSHSGEGRFSAAANKEIRGRYWTTAGAGRIGGRWMSLTPVRIG